MKLVYNYNITTSLTVTLTSDFCYLNAHRYALFGEILAEYNAYWHQGKIPDYMFNAKEYDEENGMFYYSARYYNPPTFISRDPLFEKYPWMSPYCYTANNPVKYIDPTGMEVEIVCPVTNQTTKYTPGMAIPDGASDFVSNTINTLNAMNSTTNGGIVLGDLVSSSNMFSVTDGGSANGTANFKENAAGGGTLNMNGHSDLTSIAHELFHGYQHEKGQGGASIFNEVEAYVFSEAITLDYNKGMGATPFATSRNPNTYNGNSYTASANQLINGSTFSQNDFDNTVNLFKSESIKNSVGIYNNLPIRRSNQKTNLLSRFYPLW
jgi:RHS repeat-associated protein